MRRAPLLALLPALAGLVLGAHAYLSPGTGVTGTPGALIAMLGAAAVAVGAVAALWPALRGGLLGLLVVLLVLGAILTGLAAWFLMQYAFAAAMGLVLLGLALSALSAGRRAA